MAVRHLSPVPDTDLNAAQPANSEVVALARHPHVSRALLFAVNLLIVAYLGRKALREHRERVSQRGVS